MSDKDNPNPPKLHRSARIIRSSVFVNETENTVQNTVIEINPDISQEELQDLLSNPSTSTAIFNLPGM